MPSDLVQAAVSLLCLALLVGAAVGGGSFVSLSAPVSGEAWGPAYGAKDGSVASSAADAVTGPRRIENPYGEATVRYDEWGVPHIEASNERALYYAVGYVQARDRLYQMDLQRRLMEGNLSAAFGARALDSDRFHRRMGFDDAANASWRRIQGTDTGGGVRAYTEGVNRFIDSRPLPVEFRVNGYEPTRWTPQDTLIVGKLIAWQLTGDFADLKQRTIARKFASDRRQRVRELYPRQLDHGSAIVDRRQGGDLRPSEPVAGSSMSDDGTAAANGGETAASLRSGGAASAGVGALYDSLAPHEPAPYLGSNSWVVSGEHTRSGSPIVANDPHLSLNVPPVWYEQHLRVTGDGGESMDVRGVAFPGVPTVVIGGNDQVSWGFTNVGADQVDLYTYTRPSEDTYVHDGEVREIQEHTETIPVADGRDREVTIKRTVHGPLLERETASGTASVGVAWVGLGDTRESRAIYRLNKAGDLDEVREVMRRFDSPTQNFVAADTQDGGTYFRITGRYPIRKTDNRTVRGDRVFNGSKGQGEWPGYEPYGRTNWTTFHDYDDVPEVRNPGYLATANQRTMDDPPFYIAASERYADPYRGDRIYELLEQRTGADRPVTRQFVKRMQRDVHSAAAEGFTPIILDAREEMGPDARAAADSLDGWDYNMTADSRQALLYRLWLDHYRNETFSDEFGARGLDESYYPHDYRLQTLPANSSWFDDRTTSERERRADIAARAMRQAVREADREGLETWGEYNRLDLNHQFPLSFLDYPERPMDGAPYTVKNFRSQRGTQAGSSWRMVAADGGSAAIIPGGQSGNPYSPHYDDQLDPWAEGRYKPMTREMVGDRELLFVTSSGDDDSDDGGDGS